jgi:hypothetical protein
VATRPDLGSAAAQDFRRLRKTSGGELLLGAMRMLLSPVKFFTHRDKVEKIWYDSNRASDHILPNSWVMRISNAIALLFILVMLSGPLGQRRATACPAKSEWRWASSVVTSACCSGRWRGCCL